MCLSSHTPFPPPGSSSNPIKLSADIYPYYLVTKDLQASRSSLTVTGTWQRFLTCGDMGASSEQLRR